MSVQYTHMLSALGRDDAGNINRLAWMTSANEFDSRNVESADDVGPFCATHRTSGVGGTQVREWTHMATLTVVAIFCLLCPTKWAISCWAKAAALGSGIEVLEQGCGMT